MADYSYLDNPAKRAFEAFIPKPSSPLDSLAAAGAAGMQAGAQAGVSSATTNKNTGGGNGGGDSNNVLTGLSGGATGATTPLDANTMEQSVGSPDPSVYLLNSPDYQNANLSDKLSQATSSMVGGNQQVIDSLLKQREQDINNQIPGAQADVEQLKGKYNDIIGRTDYSNKLKEVYDKFNVDQKMQDLADIQTKIVSAKNALDQGLIYEGDRPIRLDLISGRQATLKAQGLATIGALQASAQVIQGNISLAKSYADQTIQALKDDNNRSLSALNTLMKMADDKLVNLTKEEKSTVDDRISNLKKGMDQVDKNKEEVTQLMLKYPNAVAKGGVNFLDSKGEAIMKMLPTLAEEDRVKLALDQVKLEQAKFNLTKSKAKGTGGGSGGSGGGGKSLSKGEIQKLQNELLLYKSRGMSYDEAIMAYGADVPLAFINGVYPQEAGRAKQLLSPEQQFQNSAYTDVNQNPDKYNVTWDKNGKPLVSTKPAPETANKSKLGFDKHWYNPLSWF